MPVNSAQQQIFTPKQLAVTWIPQEKNPQNKKTELLCLCVCVCAHSLEMCVFFNLPSTIIKPVHACCNLVIWEA